MAKIEGLVNVNWDEITPDDGSDSPQTRASNIIPFAPTWDSPAARFTGEAQCRPAPVLDLEGLLPESIARWCRDGAESKGCPVDYVVWGMLACVASSIGNARTASPWAGWTEPAIIWPMLIGLPSAGKSPGLDAALTVLRDVECEEWKAIQPKLEEWSKANQIADIAASVHKEQTRKALKVGEPLPEEPSEMQIGPMPVLPRVVVNDSTIEKVAQIVANQPEKPCLVFRDELSGWLNGMERYSNGTDRAFWLEAYGARPFTVERMGREGDRVDRLAVSVVGGIQPGKLDDILMSSTDDGLLARFLPIWPDPVPVSRPRAEPDDGAVKVVLQRLRGLEMHEAEDRSLRPFVCAFDDAGADMLQALRVDLRAMESEAEGFLLSFLGKLPGLAVRLSLILEALHCAAEGEMMTQVHAENVERAVRLVMDYLIPMAQRTYAAASVPLTDRLALKLLDWCKRNGLRTFTVRELMRSELKGLRTAKEVNPIIAVLEDAGAIKPVEQAAGGGRPKREYEVNPKLSL